MASLRSGISSQTHLKPESRHYSEDHDTRDASSSTSLNTVHLRIQRETSWSLRSQWEREGRDCLEGMLSVYGEAVSTHFATWLLVPTAMAGGPCGFTRYRAKETRQLESSMETKSRRELRLKS